MIIPPYLKKGDLVAIVCTARAFSIEEVQPAIKWLENLGLKVRLGSTIGKKHFQFGGTDAERTADFQTQMDDNEVKAIWCARGGYGTVRMADDLNFEHFLKHPKWVIGYSDVTVLHSIIHNLGIATLHGIMAFSVPNAPKEILNAFAENIFGTWKAIRCNADDFNQTGSANAVVVGGNLSMLYSMCGSTSGLNTDGKILFIEDLDELLYHVDRMMYNLKRNGYLDNLSGLIVGGMTDMRDHDNPFGYDAKTIIKELVKDKPYPVCFDFPAGHIANNNAILLGAKALLEVKENEVVFTQQQQIQV